MGSQIIFETGCAYNKRAGECVFGLSHGVQIVHGSPIYAEEGKDNMTLYAHRGDEHAHDLYGFHHWRASNSGWQVVYDRVLSTFVFYDHGSQTIVIWTIKTTEFEGEVAPGVERWREFPEMILHEIEIDDPYGRGVDAIPLRLGRRARRFATRARSHDGRRESDVGARLRRGWHAHAARRAAGARRPTGTVLPHGRPRGHWAGALD